MDTVREPAVAGRFYPGSPEKLLRDVQAYTLAAGEKLRAFGCIVPHAGYMYSGHVAGEVFARLQLPSRFIILCPNHTGMGAPLSILSEGIWRTPLGEVPVETELAQQLKKYFNLLTEDALAHVSEHALEVQLPFLQALLGDFSFVPITVGTARLDVLLGLGEAMGRLLQSREAGQPGKDVLIIASSDMNHYESDQVTRIKDQRALDRIRALDPAGLHEVVTQHHVSMCGFGPAISMIQAAKMLGATRGEIIRYATSGDINGQRDQVVGYAGVVVV
ncbi:MAG TPA: AmmeMemoRadiSam system protein B [Anaerolineales bacterium]